MSASVQSAPRLASRLARVKPSSTLAMTSKVLELQQKGVKVIGFAAGEPDFPTWESVCESAHDAIRAGEFRYTAVGGTPRLKQAIRTKLERDNALVYSDAEVIASCGGKHSLYNAMQAVLDEGDEVVIPGPYWVSYPDMAALSGGVAKIAMASEANGFLLTPAELEAALTPATKLVVLNSPSNPTGATYSEEQIAALARVLAKHSCWVIVDDVYEMIRYDGTHPRHLVTLEPSLRDRTIICNSVSKTYAMTGWRIGYTAAPTAVIRAITTLQSQSTSNPSSIAQAAAAAALSGPQELLTPMVEQFRKRRDYICERVGAIDGLSVAVPGGAFYVFINGRDVFAKAGVTDGDGLALRLLEGAEVGVVGGNDFGSRDHFRISYATSMEMIERGMDSIERYLGSL
ncbi:MAG TPA: pyridoxal phosphate-dependent aminotransferase [Candidatus Limnocylindrales bacterium]|nr:pyridoxal phosphate-dependent aminotransferase [Candidatus Limnocylindrales bacterium]